MKGGQGTEACLLVGARRRCRWLRRDQQQYLEWSSPVQRKSLFEDFVVSAFPQTFADSGGDVVDPYPSASRVFGAAEEGIGESGIVPVYPSNGEGVLLTHKFVGPLLTLASEVAKGELVAVEVLMGITVRSIKDGEGGGAREASDVDFIGGKARGGANGRRILVFVSDHG